LILKTTLSKGVKRIEREKVKGGGGGGDDEEEEKQQEKDDDDDDAKLDLLSIQPDHLGNYNHQRAT
jgi:hypothetical protein